MEYFKDPVARQWLLTALSLQRQPLALGSRPVYTYFSPFHKVSSSRPRQELPRRPVSSPSESLRAAYSALQHLFTLLLSRGCGLREKHFFIANTARHATDTGCKLGSFLRSRPGSLLILAHTPADRRAAGRTSYQCSDSSLFPQSLRRHPSPLATPVPLMPFFRSMSSLFSTIFFVPPPRANCIMYDNRCRPRTVDSVMEVYENFLLQWHLLSGDGNHLYGSAMYKQQLGRR